MNYEMTTISLLFFIASFVYIFWGFYIMKIGSKSSRNILFLLVCISISIWSFGFARANIALNSQSALFWHRFAALGWSTAYGFILHFLILLSGKNKTLKEKRLYCLLHIPGIISMYVFSISNKLAPIHYNLMKNEYGWINKLTNNYWDLFFNIYYISYMLIGMLILWNWQKKAESKLIARQGQFILFALVFSSTLGSFTDRIAGSLLENSLPQMAPLFILLPTWAMYHSARYYGLMDEEVTKKEDTIVTAEDRRNISGQLSISFYLIGILAFIVDYIPSMNEENALKFAFLKGVTFIGIGLGIRIIQIIKSQSLKENLTIGLLLTSIPLVLFQYIEHASITIWSFAIVIMTISTIFSRRKLLVLSTTVTIITQIIIWVLQPEVTVMINKYDYILRIGILLVVFSTGSFINKMYINKIKESEYQSSFQIMNTKISSDFITVNKENIDEKINNMLREMGLFFNPDIISLFSINEESGEIVYSHEWCNEGIDSKKENFEKVFFKNFTWWTDQLEDNRVISIKDTRKMPKSANNEKKQFEKLKIKSVVSVPIEGKNGMSAFLSISSINSYREWPEKDIKLLHILANLIADATFKIKSEEEVEYMAYYDSLTKLSNRAMFRDRLNKNIKQANNTNTLIGVIYVDLDNFKSVNRIMGYEGGDELLRKVAERLKKFLGKTVEVARFSADEFMISLKDVKESEDILELADKIIQSFSKSFCIKGQELSISSSVGISIYPLDGEDADTLIENANLAMHQVNDKGKSKYTLYKAKMKKEMEKKILFLNDLELALEKNELELYYQPQVNLKTGKINGAEALVRWIHPERGMISPGIFIPLAEDNGLINDIGEWVLKTACIQNKKWQDMGLKPLPIGVNLSAAQLIDVNIVDYVKKVLKESGLDPQWLELEITESVTIGDVEYIEKVIWQLKEMGISIAIDDFGTEHSSFSRLKTLPIDRIKIDMEFIQGIEKSEKDRTITKTMINLARGLGTNVIGEGVESQKQVDFLKTNGCYDVQGYYYYKPMPAKEIEEILMIESKKRKLIQA